jgi:predicted nucleic acid-binding protein
MIKAPISAQAVSPITDLGPGESQVLMLTLEIPASIAILDDALARRIAIAKGFPIKGTLGLLLDAKRGGHSRSCEAFSGTAAGARFSPS